MREKCERGRLEDSSYEYCGGVYGGWGCQNGGTARPSRPCICSLERYRMHAEPAFLSTGVLLGLQLDCLATLSLAVFTSRHTQQDLPLPPLSLIKPSTEKQKRHGLLYTLHPSELAGQDLESGQVNISTFTDSLLTLTELDLFFFFFQKRWNVKVTFIGVCWLEIRSRLRMAWPWQGQTQRLKVII